MAVLVFFVPRFVPVFSNFQVRLTAPTRLLLRASELCIRDYLWMILLPLPALWALANFSIPNAQVRRRLRLLAFLFVSAFLVFTLLALFVPLLQLIQGVSTPAPRP
jgi:type II secretory pathway component PulF